MRVETKTVTYYTLAELKEHHPNGYDRALDKLRVSQWDGGWPREDVEDTIEQEFTMRVAISGDRVNGVELKGWAVQDRGAYVGFEGTLTPENSPALPWHEYLEQVDLRAGRSYTEINIRDSEDAPYLGYRGIPAEGNAEHAALIDARSSMQDAVDAALSEALAAGEKQAEYLDSEENLLEQASANEWEFDQHGEWA